MNYHSMASSFSAVPVHGSSISVRLPCKASRCKNHLVCSASGPGAAVTEAVSQLASGPADLSQEVCCAE